MRLKDKLGRTYDVDVRRKMCQTDTVRGFQYDIVVGAYVGSPSAEFRSPDGHCILSTEEIVEAEDVPADNVSGESGNVVFRTENSAYEIDQEQKLFRRLAGTNQPTNAKYPDGEWRSYDRVDLVVGYPALIYYEPGLGKAKRTSIVRDITGTLATPPAREVISIVVGINIAPDV